VQQNNWIFI